MGTDMHMFTVEGAVSAPMPQERLETHGFLETRHLEQWVVDNPQVLGDDVKIVSTQYDKWSSEFGDLAKERLDVLGLDRSGQLVVVELKRGTDSRIHLQAITYAALVAGFDKKTLATAHSEYLNRIDVGAETTSAGEALAELEEHVGGEWDDDILTVPKIVLLAEDFSAQTYTTVTWLAELTPNLSIEMHTVNVFVLPGPSPQPCVVFRRLYPTEDPATRVLTPGVAASADAVATKIANKKRADRSTYLLHDNEIIPEGAVLELNLRANLAPDAVEKVEAWIAQKPGRGEASWVCNRAKPLQWLGSDDPLRTWAPTSLAKHIIEQAIDERRESIPGGDVWYYQGTKLIVLAGQIDNPVN
ncbi:DNA-binding protein [Rhodococcus erythropolis]|uniref:DNA-binding protein n=1 Tax=Rhodococcus erythropolis TaxID=1833 RepID=UPI00294991E2|nr:DNA-binding protein [Rhodococcus erythropolis]MDV6209927.1 DNA-binding protein [Rhodococcus erythropolis]